MDILEGRQTDSFRGAARIALRHAGKLGMSPEVLDLFAELVDTDKFTSEAKKENKSAVRARFGRNSGWSGNRWLVPVPHLTYEATPVPRLIFSTQAYSVAAITVTANRTHGVTLVGSIGKPEKLVLPVSFLQAILDEDLGQFEVIGKDENYTRWALPGLKEAVRLPDGFVTGLRDVLKGKSVATWLQEFGNAGKAIMPLAVGTLLGLQFHDKTVPLARWEQPFKRETIIAHLTRLYGSGRAAEMVEQAAPYLKSTMTNGEAMRVVMKESERR